MNQQWFEVIGLGIDLVGVLCLLTVWLRCRTREFSVSKHFSRLGLTGWGIIAVGIAAQIVGKWPGGLPWLGIMPAA